MCCNVESAGHLNGKILDERDRQTEGERRAYTGGLVCVCLSVYRRWCPSRRRLSLLEEVETGVMTMLSKEVGRALRGYCPQSIREGLVSRRAPAPPLQSARSIM